MNEDAYREIFIQEHDAMSSAFIERAFFYANAYLDSEAGKLYAQDSNRFRNSHKPQVVLNIDVLRSYRTKPGIKWEPGDILSFFSHLNACSHTEVMVRFTA